ncbi:hypothetical protein CC86DRAFT_158227 [Ophiobolus disseminans]|uniref:Uncharacterized protein n=1 Tax=Ophiobolus disseminans TaxID=1469910 RepID=A0A6A6ZDS5_9PLEO|nr:hypothetical protein CC86DRAFT_158227 [Ophiobolus disseminans]
MKSFTAIVLAALAITQAVCQLSIIDTVAEEDHAKLNTVLAIESDNSYVGYFYNETTVSIKIHDSVTDNIIAEETFKGNGKSVEYLSQIPGAAANIGAEGAEMGTEAQRCPSPPKKRDINVFERASRCYQFCARSYSCTVDRRCRRCQYVGGLCRWQLWCV